MLEVEYKTVYVYVPYKITTLIHDVPDLHDYANKAKLMLSPQS